MIWAWDDCRKVRVWVGRRIFAYMVESAIIQVRRARPKSERLVNGLVRGICGKCSMLNC